MAQTKRKRQTKHRGTAAGQVTNRGRTSKPPSPDEVKKQKRDEARASRLTKKPTWSSAALRSALAALFICIFLLVTTHKPATSALFRRDRGDHLHPHGLLHRDDICGAGGCASRDGRRRDRCADVHGRAGAGELLRRPPSERVYAPSIVDPGDEAERILEALRALEVDTVEAILLTHCHFDHIGAVAPVARATGAPVYCPELETAVLADIMAYVPYPGFGPFESYDADHTIEGGETLQLAGLEFEVDFVPGHSPGHVSYALSEHQALFSGDVLFQGSVGRVDLPGGDWPTLLASIERLLDKHTRLRRPCTPATWA